jgi:outer membrane lipoprotein SlyB
MISPFRAIRLALMLCAWHALVLAASRPLELKWGELSPIIGGQRVQLVLPGGTTIKGEAIAVREEALVMDVKGTSNAKAYPKGSATIPRASVTLIQVERRRGAWGRKLGTVVGVLCGVVLGGYVAAVTADSAGAGIATFLGIASAGTVGGYYVGKRLDKQVTLIKIVP